MPEPNYWISLFAGFFVAVLTGYFLGWWDELFPKFRRGSMFNAPRVKYLRGVFGNESIGYNWELVGADPVREVVWGKRGNEPARAFVGVNPNPFDRSKPVSFEPENPISILLGNRPRWRLLAPSERTLKTGFEYGQTATQQTHRQESLEEFEREALETELKKIKDAEEKRSLLESEVEKESGALHLAERMGESYGGAIGKGIDIGSKARR